MEDKELLQKILDNQKQLHLEMKAVKQDTNTIKRAIYGDPDNLVSGLIHRQVEHGNRIKALENMRLKIIYASGGFVIALKAIEVIFFRG